MSPFLRSWQERCWPASLCSCGVRSAQTESLSHDTKPPVHHHLSICGPRTCPPVPSQCLNAVRTVQSLACLEEADHTVGFLLQLSSFMKEWHFHLPQLMRDVQVGPRTRHLEGSGEILGDRVRWGLSGHLQRLHAHSWNVGFCLGSIGFGFMVLPLELAGSLLSIGQPCRLRDWAFWVRLWFLFPQEQV